MRSASISSRDKYDTSGLDPSKVDNSDAMARRSYDNLGSNTDALMSQDSVDDVQSHKKSRSNTYDGSHFNGSSLGHMDTGNDALLSVESGSDLSHAHLGSFFTNNGSRSAFRPRGSARSYKSEHEFISEQEQSEVLRQSYNSAYSGLTKQASSDNSVVNDDLEPSDTELSTSEHNLENTCVKYGLTTESIQDILSGRRQSIDGSGRNRDQFSENSDASCDSFRDEMLIYLLKQQIKLKNKLKVQKNMTQLNANRKDLGSICTSSGAHPSVTKSQSVTKKVNMAKYCKNLEELGPEELECLDEMLDFNDNSGTEDLDATPSSHLQESDLQWTRGDLSDVAESAQETDLYSSQEATPWRAGGTANSHKIHDRVSNRNPNIRKKRKSSSADSIISQEADSLHNEINELIHNLENTGLRDSTSMPQGMVHQGFPPMQQPFVTVPYGYQVPPDMYQLDAVDYEEPDEMVLPIKVPTKPPQPEVVDAEVMTDETARMNQLNAFERFTREIEQQEQEQSMAHQTDNTRIAKDGIAWEITESYLKEEERKLLQERKRAELLRQMNEPPTSKSVALRDYYNQWVAKKEAAKQMGGSEEHIGLETSTPQRGIGGPIHKTNVFRRTRDVTRSSEDTAAEVSHPRHMTYPKVDASTTTHEHQRQYIEATEEGREYKDVYIKGTWDPRTGAIKISNDIDSTQITDKPNLVDHVNLSKQNPGNLMQENWDMDVKPAEDTLATNEELGLHLPDIGQSLNRERTASDDSVGSSPKNSARSSSTDSANRLYEKDEFNLPSGPMPGDLDEEEYTPGGRRKYAMGFSDFYMPPIRNATDVYNTAMSMMNRAPFKVAEETKHHHYHYYNDRRHRRCHHRRKHKHCCSKKKEKCSHHCSCSHKSATTSSVEPDGQVAPTVLVQKHVPTPAVWQTSPRSHVDTRTMYSPRSPNNVVNSTVLPHTLQMDMTGNTRVVSTSGAASGASTPVSAGDIVTDVFKAKSTDFVKVTMYHEASDAKTERQKELLVFSPTNQKLLSTMIDTNNVLSDGSISPSMRSSVYMPGIPNVFKRRVNSRVGSPRTCTSPLRRIEEFDKPSCCCTTPAEESKEDLEQEVKTEPKETEVEYDTGMEYGEQFTFRGSEPEVKPAESSPSMYRTRVIYVGQH
ncbi:hypothetical protein BaOVIS_025790 [Babesia ovis]|uniref:Uncharacterized protein n=1 Tax=Babesia ovis TaxID=5869 RepID=A0A9W5TCV9_BABOV|nr:hypothetical protein BaOVIS_025790 [Babesia ovis]